MAEESGTEFRKRIRKQVIEKLAEIYEVDQDDPTLLTDALTDLRHHADEVKAGFHTSLDQSYNHYLAERKEDRR